MTPAASNASTSNFMFALVIGDAPFVLSALRIVFTASPVCSASSATDRVALLKRQLAAAKRKENNLWELAADLGVKAKFGFLGKLDEVQEEAAGLERQISAQESLLARAIRPLSASEAAEKAAAMRRLMLGADIQKKRQFVQAVIQKVIVKDDEIEIVGHDSTVAESACDLRISKAPPVRGFEREWCRLEDSNL